MNNAIQTGYTELEPEDVDVRYLEVDHGAECDCAARDELGSVHHEVRVHEEHAAHAEVPRVEDLDELLHDCEVRVELNLAGAVEDDVVVVNP